MSAPGYLRSCSFGTGALALGLLWGHVTCAQAQTAVNVDAPQAVLPETDLGAAPLIRPASPPANVFNHQRIMGVIPDYQTVNDSTKAVPPLTPRQKWDLALKETIDPYNLVSAAIGAGFSQAGNETPKYGEGPRALGERFGAAVADMTTQNFFSAVVVSVLLHQDPRYFRLGPQASVPKRIWYSVNRLFVCRNDSGKPVFNAANVVGMAMGIAASNLYYPSPSVRWSVMAGRFDTSLFGGLTGNLMSEFWPDIHDKFFHRKSN